MGPFESALNGERNSVHTTNAFLEGKVSGVQTEISIATGAAAGMEPTLLASATNPIPNTIDLVLPATDQASLRNMDYYLKCEVTAEEAFSQIKRLLDPLQNGGNEFSLIGKDMRALVWVLCDKKRITAEVLKTVLSMLQRSNFGNYSVAHGTKFLISNGRRNERL